MEATHPSPPRLLIADDDPVVRSVLGMSLSNEFAIVGTAEDSGAAIELARASQPDAALVDVEMPAGGGLAAVRGILEVAPQTAIVVLSGDETDDGVRDLIAAGAVAYRRKGIDAHELSQTLNAAIQAHSAPELGAVASQDSNV